MSLLAKFRKLDAFSKTLDEVQIRTYSGAAVSIVALLGMTLLMFSELSYYLETVVVEHIGVDTSRQAGVQINLDITFDRIPCDLIAMDALDVLGARQIGLFHRIHKQPIDFEGSKISRKSKADVGDVLEPQGGLNEGTDKPERPDDYCGSCYGAETEGECCNTCDEVRAAYNEKGWQLRSVKEIEQCIYEGASEEAYKVQLNNNEGCRLTGHFKVNKVSGKILFVPSSAFSEIHDHDTDLDALHGGILDTSHTIHELSFGESYPGQVNPLAGVHQSAEDSLAVTEGDADTHGLSFIHYYYAKVVSTQYRYLSGNDPIDTNQYSVTQNVKRVDLNNERRNDMPGISLAYEFSSVQVLYQEVRPNFLHFLTSLCAILGGVFTVAGMVARFVDITFNKFGGSGDIDLGKLN